MRDLLIRCSSLGRLMTEPRTKSEGILSKGAKTLIRELARQDILGVDFEISTKEMEKGIECEPDSIALLNRVLGLSLSKNTERKNAHGITGECDLFDPHTRRGYDLKTSWSSRTWPAFAADAEDSVYEWQDRAYMMLWDADAWETDYALVDTPDRLIGYEDMSMHVVSYIPEHLRLTRWIIERDFDKERLMIERVAAAREFLADAIKEFDETHRQLETA